MYKTIQFRENQHGCFMCTSHSVDGRGYPRIRKDGKDIRLSRLMYSMFNGRIPEGKCVMHTCDNSLCINPSHLTVGSQRDNLMDMVLKGRNKGKLNPEDIPRIRSMIPNRTQREIATEFGVSQSTISLIKIGKSWAYVE